MIFRFRIIAGSVFLFAMMLMMTARVYAQTNFAFTWYLIKDDNTFRNRNLYDEWINSLSFYGDKTFNSESSTFRAYYIGDFSRYSNYEDRGNNSHQVGMALSRLLGSNITGMLGASGRMRRNDAQYIYYNADTYNFYANIRYEPNFYNLFTAGITYKQNKFKEFSDINNITYRLFSRYQHFFQNRISISSEIGLGIKNYVNQKKQNFYGNVPFQRFKQRYIEEPVSAAMLSCAFNAGKSLTDKTGLNLGFGIQRYIGDPIETLSEDIYYYTENDLYDDPYGYENQHISLTLTRQFGIGFQAKIGAEYQDKNYRGTQAISMTGELLGTYRKDTRTDYYFIITKTFRTGLSLPSTIDGFFRLNIRNNSSNDPYYDYQDHLGMLGITISR